MDVKILVLACLIPFALGGCAGHSHSLILDQSDQNITVGTFQHEGLEEAVMVLELRGVRFGAKGFAIERKLDLAELRRLYGPGKHYDRIFSGLDTDHYVYSAEPVLRAANGATLRCSAVWRVGGSPSGHCLAGDKPPIHFRFG